MTTTVESDLLGAPSIDADGLDPVLAQLGLLVGLLQPAGADGSYPLNENWFSDPLASLKEIPSERAADIVALIEALLGSVSGTALGAPRQGDGRSWYPIPVPGFADEPSPSPFYFVAPQALDPADVTIGVGFRHAFEIDGVTVTAFAYLPLVEMGSSLPAPRFVLGSGPHPAQVGLEVHGLPLGAGGLSFDGLQFATEIFFDRAPAVELVFLDLALPGLPAKDASLADLRQLGPSEWVATALALIASQLVKALPQQQGEIVEAALEDVMRMLGLEGALPAIDWAALVAGEQQAQTAFLDWLGAIAGSPANLRSWLLALYCLFQGKTPAAYTSDPTGNADRAGTRADAFQVPLVEVAGVSLGLTVATEIDAVRTLHVYPGLTFETVAVQPVTAVPSLGIVIAASAELVAIPLPAPSHAGASRTLEAAVLGDILFPSLDASVSLRNPTAGKPLFAIGDTASKGGQGTFGVDSVRAGLAVIDGNAPVPSFTLANVVTAVGAWPSVDLVNYAEKVDVGQLLTLAVQEAVDTFLGSPKRRIPREREEPGTDRAGQHARRVGEREASAAASAVAALIGAIPPSPYRDDWPVSELLLTGGGLDLLVAHPVAALGSYYTRALAAKTHDGRVAWAQLLPELSALLGAASPTLTGTGTSADPWRSVVATLAGGVTIEVSASTGGAQELQLGLAFVMPVPLSSATVELSLAVDLLDLALPAADGSGSSAVGWLPGVAAEARVVPPGDAGTLETDPLGGLSIEVDDATVTGGWTRAAGVCAAAAIDGASIHDGAGNTFPIGTLEFVVTPTSWAPSELGELAQAAVYVAGAYMVEHGGRFGVALTTVLGLLPNLTELYSGSGCPFPMPPGFELPAGWPSLAVVDSTTFFSAPWRDVLTQLEALLASAAMGAATMQLIGWAITGTIPQAPSEAPAGTIDDPFSVVLTSVAGLEVLVWAETDRAQTVPSRLGLGLRRTMTSAAHGALRFDARVRADLALLALPAGQALAGAPAGVPRLALECALVNPAAGQPLVSAAGGLEVGSVLLGGEVTGAGFAPIASLARATPSSQTPRVTLDVASALASSSGMQLFGELLEAVMALVSPQRAQLPTLQAAFDLLEAVGLVTATPGGGYGVNLLSWMTLLADPDRYASGQVDAIFASQQRVSEFTGALAILLGRADLSLPSALEALPPVLAAFGLMVEMPTGYRLVPSGWVALAADPVACLAARARTLFASPRLRQALISELSALPASNTTTLPRGMTLTVQGGTRVELAVPSAPGIPIGDELDAAASIVLDLKALSLTAGAIVWSQLAGSALAVEVDAAAGAWEIDLAAAPTAAAPAPFAPIPLHANPARSGQQALELAVPLFVLSTAAAALLNGFMLPHSPLALRVFQALGLTRTRSSTQVGSLMAALMHPIAWVLSPAAIGDGRGGIDLAGAGKLLAAIPGPEGATGPGTTVVSAVAASGLTLSGLPFGAELSLAASATSGLTAGLTVSETVDGTTLDIAAGIACGLGSGVHLTGAAELDVTVGDGSALELKSAFATTGFTVALAGSTNGKRFPAGEGWIDLVPFEGLSQYVGEAADGLLDVVASKAWAAYQAWAGRPAALAELVGGVQSAAAAVEITSMASLIAAVEAIAKDPLGWLRQWGEPSKAAAVVTAAHALLTDTFGLSGFTLDAAGRLISYSPAIDAKHGALTLDAGMRDGAWGVWVAPELAYSVANGPRLFVEVDAGVAMSAGAVAFTLSAGGGLDVSALGVPDLAGGPELRAAVSGGSGSWAWTLALYPAGYRSDAKTLVVGLLPQPLLAYGSAPQTAVAAAQWLGRLGLEFALPLLADALLATKEMLGWLRAVPVAKAPAATAGKILTDFGVLASTGTSEDPAYALADVVALFTGATPVELLESLAHAALDAFAGVTIVPIDGGGISIVAQQAGGATDYGLGLKLPGVALTSDPSSSPQVVLQIGASQSKAAVGHELAVIGDRAVAQTGPPSASGVTVLALRATGTRPDLSLSLAPALELASVGVDVLGAQKKPLVDVSGFTLGGVEPRLWLTLADDAGTLDASFGASLQLDAIGLPLGPKLGAGSGSAANPIAQNLVSSSGGQATVNPTFSVTVAYVDDDLSVQLHSDAQDANNVVWIPIQRALGPLYCRKIGIGWEQDARLLDLGFDGSVALAGLGVDVESLGVGIPVTTPLDFGAYRLRLDGLAISFKGGPTQISGGLLESTDPKSGLVDYDGTLSIKAGTWALTALGAYSKIDNPDGGTFEPSLFVFALVSTPIGGPPFFFVTGVAAGFGYNRRLILPDQDHVAEFPLVAGVVSPASTFPDPKDMGAVFAKLHDDVPPSAGTYWLAAGVQFTTFEMLSSFALLTVEFGSELEVALLGVATLSVPTSVAGARPLARATMQLEVLIEPDEGVVAATATLTPDSFVLDPAVHLTGGFALDVWFGSNPNAGDFVVTLGGYHPSFVPPPHYPDEPRLGFNWSMGDVQLKGGAYFALTPSCVMAGGSLSLTYSSGNLSAWFDAYADFLARWRPFYFEADIGVSIGASYRVHALFIDHTFTIELSADLNMRGTPVGGHAHVHWHIISFTVPFGDDADVPELTTWGQFDSAFLPQPPQQTADADADAATGQVLLAHVDVGLMGNVGGDVDRWIVNPRKFRLVTSSIVPATAATLNGDAVPLSDPVGGVQPNLELGVRPLGSASLTSTHAIAFRQLVAGTWQPVDTEYLDLTPVLKGAPDALWSADPQPGGPPQPSATVLAGTVSGFTIDSTEELLDVLGPFEVIGNVPQTPVVWTPLAPPTAPRYAQSGQAGQLMAALDDPAVAERRGALVTALQESNPQLDPAAGLPVMARFGDQLLQAQPSLVTLGGQLDLAGVEQ